MPEGNRICVASPVIVSSPIRSVGVHAKLLSLIKAGNYFSSSLLSAPCTNQRLLLSGALINLIKATLINKGAIHSDNYILLITLNHLLRSACAQLVD